jgi:hypothetical protein
MELQDTNLSYIRGSKVISWTTSIRERIISWRQLQTFLRVNVIDSDTSHLGISQMTKLDLQRHCFAMVLPKRVPAAFRACVSPYGPMLRNELVAIAAHIVGSEDEEDDDWFVSRLDACIVRLA